MHWVLYDLVCIWTLSPASGDFCRLLVTFANSLTQVRLDKLSDEYSWKILHLPYIVALMVFLMVDGIPERFFFLKNLILKKIHRRWKSVQNYPACKELKKKRKFRFCIFIDNILIQTSIFTQSIHSDALSPYHTCPKIWTSSFTRVNVLKFQTPKWLTKWLMQTVQNQIRLLFFFIWQL